MDFSYTPEPFAIISVGNEMVDSSGQAFRTIKIKSEAANDDLHGMVDCVEISVRIAQPSADTFTEIERTARSAAVRALRAIAEQIETTSAGR